MDHGVSPQEEQQFHDSLEDWGGNRPDSPGSSSSPPSDDFTPRFGEGDPQQPLQRLTADHDGDEDDDDDDDEDDDDDDEGGDDQIHSGSFTFSEDDLIPASSTSYLSSYPNNQHGSYTYVRRTNRLEESQDDDTDVLYSDAPSKSFDPKISVSRTVLVSQPSAPDAQPHPPQQSLSRSNSRSLSLTRSSSLSRRFAGFTWKQKQDAKMKSRSHEQEAESIVYSLSDAGFKIPGRKSNKRDADSILRQASVNSSSEGLAEPLSQQDQPERKDSMSKRKSRMSFGSLLKFTPPSDTPPKSPSDDSSRPFENRTEGPPREPTPEQTPRRYPTTPLARPSPTTSNPASLPTSSHSEKPITLLQGTVNETRASQKSEYKPNRDELWTLFRMVDAEHQKFLTIPIDQKGEPVRRVLLPFLKTTRDHHSNANLHPLDLDRRTVILNKWWTALLDALGNQLKQQISASDRPSLLEATTSIMERPEWRAYPSPFYPAKDLDPARQSRRGSRESSESDHDKFVEQSAHHNVRNMFVHNLFTQIKFAVDKMSLKNIPVGLVSFCGKTCAFAFFFCAGIGEILIRLWDLTNHNIQRIFRSCNLHLMAQYSDTAESVTSLFPDGLRPLVCSSFKEATTLVKTKQIYPLGVEKVDWRGAWLKRWSGHESDLFYTFLKEYHSILSQFLPFNTTKHDYIWAPGLIFVRAQILANLESTLHRNPNSAAMEASNEPLLTLDGFMDPSDSNASFPGPLANASRFMGENRLVMLIRNIVSDSCTLDTPTCLIIAEGFADALRVAIESTSLYDHNACCTLCEMLQESLPALASFQRKQPDVHLINWDFLIAVFRKMTESENTMTELRLYTMLFAIWESIASVETWRLTVCHKFLLDVDFFCSRFSHWCPMLRSYFQRLICWRVARYDDDSDGEEQASVGDQELLGLLKSRLMLVWSHFKYGVSLRVGTSGPGLSTAPSNPLPGRRLLIIRSNIFVNPPLLPLESFNQPSKKTTVDSPKDMAAGLQNVVPFFEKFTAGLDMNKANKRNSNLFRSMFGYGGSLGGSREESPTRDRDDALTSESVRKDIATDGESSRTSMYESRPLKESNQPASAASRAAKPNIAGSRRVKATFKFSMELLDRYPQNNIPNDMMLYPPRLPLPAQQVLESQPGYVADVAASRPRGEAARRVIYLGHALAEWYLAVNECQNFFERRKNEGVASNRLVETPTLTADTLRRPGL